MLSIGSQLKELKHKFGLFPVYSHISTVLIPLNIENVFFQNFTLVLLESFTSVTYSIFNLIMAEL